MYVSESCLGLHMFQGRKPRSVEDMCRMDVTPDSPSSCNEGLPESLQVEH